MDEALKVWNELKDIPVNDDMEIECNFMHFEKGEDIHTIWKYIEEMMGVSIVDLQRAFK